MELGDEIAGGVHHLDRAPAPGGPSGARRPAGRAQTSASAPWARTTRLAPRRGSARRDERAQRLAAEEPRRVRRHGRDDVLAQQRRERAATSPDSPPPRPRAPAEHGARPASRRPRAPGVEHRPGPAAARCSPTPRSVTSSAATSAADHLTTSRRIRTARCVAGRWWSARRRTRGCTLSRAEKLASGLAGAPPQRRGRGLDPRGARRRGRQRRRLRIGPADPVAPGRHTRRRRRRSSSSSCSSRSG